MGKLIKDFEELEQWLDGVGRTIQMVRRIRNKPRWMVRILRASPQDHIGEQWVEATDDELEVAVEKALEAFFTLPE